MNSLERKILDKVENYLPQIVFVVVSLIGFYIRFYLRTIVSGDAHMCLMPWYNAIAENGLYTQVGDYGMLYQFVIWLMTRFPGIPNLFAYKIFSCFFDYVIAITAAVIVYRIDTEDKCWRSVAVYSLILLCPTVFINSAAWAQCDAVYTAFALLGIYCLDKEKYNWALVFLGISFSFKLHAAFVLPVFLFYYFVKRRFSIVRFLIVPAMMIVTALPLTFWGRNPFETFSIYANQTSSYPAMANEYPSVWLLMFSENNEAQYECMGAVAIVITVCVLALLMGGWIRNKYMPTNRNLLLMTFLLTYNCVFFLPSMHERYGYVYEICAIMIAVIIPKTIPLATLLIAMSTCTYSAYLFCSDVDFIKLSWLNLFVYVIYVLVLNKELISEKEEVSVSE